MLSLIALTFVLQSPQLTAVLKPDQPFRIEWQGSPTDSFRWWCDDQILVNFKATDLTKGTEPDAQGLVRYEAPVPGLKEGTHSCKVSAYKQVWTDAGMPDQASAPIPVPALTSPVTPIGLKLVITVIK